MATNKKPANTLRCGNIKATIWENVSEKGPFFATSFSRPFKDQSGKWRNGTSFVLNDLEALVTVAREAKEPGYPKVMRVQTTGKLLYFTTNRPIRREEK